jgi:hypothetical protein
VLAVLGANIAAPAVAAPTPVLLSCLDNPAAWQQQLLPLISHQLSFV